MMGSFANAAPISTFPLTGEIEKLTVNNDNGIYSSGVMVVGGHEVILPKNLLIDLPANRLTLRQIFDQAPTACVALGESGLAKADKCNATGTGGNAAISANRTNAGNDIAGDVFIQKGLEIVTGQVTYINYTDGYYRLNGLPNDPNTGVMVRLNDPTSRHTVQQGLGCIAGSLNCSADPRFTLDPDNYVNTFTTGYPYCIPSTVSRAFTAIPGITGPAQSSATGSGDVLCPQTNRTPGVIVENPVADSRVFAPIIIGDSVSAEGNFETISGVHFLSAHTTKVNKALQTRNVAGQPDYLFLDEVFIDGPAFQNQRVRTLIIGYTTLAPTDVDFWTIHRDPVNNAIHEFPLASVQGCDTAAGVATCGAQGLGGGAGNNIFRIRYDVDFNIAPAGVKPGGKLSPCDQLLASTRFRVSNPNVCPANFTMADQFAVLSPMPHEIQARTGHLLDSPAGSLVTIDINGKPATNGQYLFPFGMNLGGIDIPNFFEIDLNLINTPTIFEGIPWNLDRRLSPGGCQNAGGCEAGAVGSTTFALDPFPFSGLDPRFQASLPRITVNNLNFTATPLTNADNRIFSYVSGTNFNGNATVLPYALGTFPPDPALITINPTPVLSIFPPIADEDATSTTTAVPVTISVLTNDFPVFGSIDPLSLKIATPPASGTAVVNLPAGTITYTPTVLTTGTVTFTYTVANNFGAASLPGNVNVTILKPPVAVNDNFSTPANSSIPIKVVANDTAGTNIINLASVNILSGPTCGSIVNQANGTVIFSAPAAVPAAPGTCSFSYVVSDTSIPAMLSNVATVTVAITPAQTTVAGNDTATTATGSAVNINVIANDTATAPATINPATLAVTAATGGSAAANSNGTVSYTAPAVAGIYSFTYTVKDNAVSPATSNVATVTVTALAPPTGTIVINGGAALTSSASVTLTLSATSPNGAVTQMQFSKDGVTFFPFEPFAATRVVTLLPGDGLKTMYVRFKDSAGIVSIVYSDSITLNTAAIAGTISINGGANLTTSASATLALSATSAAGTVTQMQFSKDGVNFFPLEPFAATRVVTLLPGDGLKTMTVRFKDSAGIVSVPISAGITLDTTKPTGTIAFTTPSPTTSAIGTLALTATDANGVNQMQFSHDGVNFFPFEPFVASRTVSLAVGLNTLIVRFKDGAGNVSAPVSTTITRN